LPNILLVKIHQNPIESKNLIPKLLSVGYTPSFFLHNSILCGLKDVKFWRNAINDDSLFDELTQNCWFELTEKPIFKINTGSRITKIEQIGKGGFGSVFKENLHNEIVAVKCIDRTCNFRTVDHVNKNSILDVFVQDLFGKTFVEAVTQKKLMHKNILKATEAWIQFSNLNKVELNISMPLCQSNLSDYLDHKSFDFSKIRKFLLQITDALKYIRDQQISHKDVKGGWSRQNIYSPRSLAGT
jgi:hypothetical protein